VENDFEIRVGELIEKHGNFYFFQQALEKQKVTRQIIRAAKSKNSRTAFFHYLLSLTIIGMGLSGYHKSKPMELLFLIPIGVWWFWFWHLRVRRIKSGVDELSKLTSGIHSKKLKLDQFSKPT